MLVILAQINITTMKKIVYLLFAASFISVSCSNNDDSDNNEGANATVYLPDTEGTYWVYDTEAETSGTTGRDSLYTANDTVIGAETYKKFKTGAMATGFYSGALSGNSVRQSGGKLILNGAASLNFSEDLPLAISVTNFTFFDAGATPTTQLGITSGTISQTIQNYPVNVDYELKAVAGTDVTNFTANGITYTNVKTVKMTLTASVKVMLTVSGLQVPVPAMEEQPVLVSTQYYAENIGVVKVETDIDYHLSDFSSLGITLPIDSSGSEHQEELLVNYHIGQ